MSLSTITFRPSGLSRHLKIMRALEVRPRAVHAVRERVIGPDMDRQVEKHRRAVVLYERNFVRRNYRRYGYWLNVSMRITRKDEFYSSDL